MGKFDKYKIDLKGMRADTCKYEFVLDNLFFANIDGPEVQKGKVNVVLLVKRTSRAFELNFQTEGVVWVPCDRCLEDMEQLVNSTDKLLVKFGREYAEEGDNLIVIPEEEGEINVAWFMYEFVALAIPMKHVHAPGKCNKTMTSKLSKHLRTTPDDESEEAFIPEEETNLMNDEEESQIDPRWEELKKILDNN
ncbi:YceD family protein [Bacteroides heparinolyticus]|uniref:YceD family protein n=1 Tax=Prevotella heparinolytica TaxID=28113 RepID=UPI00359FFDDE